MVDLDRWGGKKPEGRVEVEVELVKPWRGEVLER